MENLQMHKSAATPKMVIAKKNKTLSLTGDIYKAKSAYIKYSIKKAKEVVGLISGKKVENAVNQLKFCRRQAFSKELLKVLNEAISNAENNFGQDIDRLAVRTVLLEKGFSLRRFRAKSKGRAGRVNKPFIRVVVELSTLAS